MFHILEGMLHIDCSLVIKHTFCIPNTTQYLNNYVTIYMQWIRNF